MNANNRSSLAWLAVATAAFSPAALAQPGGSERDVVAATLTGGVETFTPARDARATSNR